MATQKKSLADQQSEWMENLDTYMKEPAFPYVLHPDDDAAAPGAPGLSRLEYFAAEAMKARITLGIHESHEQLADTSIAYAVNQLRVLYNTEEPFPTE